MRKPYFRVQSGTWVIKLPGGRLKTLGSDPNGADRKLPPQEIIDEWHALSV